MKVVEKVLIVFVFLLCIWVNLSMAESGKVNVSATRLREENNTDSEILTNIYENEKVEILEEKDGWYKVKYGDNTGYVKKEYITKSDESNTSSKNEVDDNKAQIEEEPVSGSKIKTISTTNVRNSPTLMSQVIYQFEESKELTKVSEIGNWIQVTDGSISGWIVKAKINSSNTQSSQVDTSNFANTTNQNTIENENTTVDNKIVQNTTVDNKVIKNTVAENKVNENTVTNVNKIGIIDVTTAKVRKEPTTNSSIVDLLDKGDKITITAEEGDWYKMTFEDISGYVSKSLVKVQDKQVTSRSLTENRMEEDDTLIDEATNNDVNKTLSGITTNTAQNVADYAKQYVGTPYIVGGKNPTSGFDCSGFTRYVYLNFGYSLGSTAATQTDVGTVVSRENLQVGDLILFYDEGKTKIGHTGVYLGNGEFVHAANPKRGVVIDNLNTNTYYNERFISARRIVT